MNQFIAQSDRICENCNREIPQGAFFHPQDDYDLCQDCGDELEARGDIAQE